MCSNIYIFIRSLVYVLIAFVASSFGALQVDCLSPTLLFLSILSFFERGKDFSMVFSFQFIFSRLLNAISFSFINKLDSVENIVLLLISIFSSTFFIKAAYILLHRRSITLSICQFSSTSSGLISAIFFILRPSTHKFSSYKLLISALSSEKLIFLVSRVQTSKSIN